jgi:ribosomal protein L37AE/L43A
MALSAFGDLPRDNPCAQCGEPIAMPDWVEPGASRVAYLWYCRACDYRFEAVAYFDDRAVDQEALAA